MELSLLYKWIKEYVKTDLDAEGFAKKVSLGGPSIEKWDFLKEFDDNLLEIEVTPNRVDMASVIGLAREAATILNTDLLYKEKSLNFKPVKTLPFNVEIKDFDLCRRYQSIVIDGVKVSESPKWMQDRLKASGLNPHNNIVDITNYVLLEYGQPVHAFDYDKLEGKKIVIRRAKNKEKFVSLDNDTYELDESMLAITDDSGIIALAGIKGGKGSGISASTKTIAIEVANFDPVSVRKTWRKLDLQTDASSLFEKGLNIGLTTPALARVIELILELAGGEIASEVFDVKQKELKPKFIDFKLSEIDRILGVDISKSEVVSILNRLGFECEDNKDYLKVKVPYFREMDIEFDYDLVEEIARIYGYHNIPSELMHTPIPKVKTAPDLIWEEEVKTILSDVGLTETIAYSLIAKKELDVMEISEDLVLSVTNPLTSDFVYLRTNLSSGLIQITSENESYADKLTLFALDKVYIPTGEKELPNEQSNLVILVNSTKKEDAFYEVKGYLEHLFSVIGIKKSDYEFIPGNSKEPFMAGATAEIKLKNKNLGVIGIITAKAKNIFGIKKEVCVMELNFEDLLKVILETKKSYKPIPKYPNSTRDFAFIIKEEVSWKSLEDIVIKLSGNIYKDSELFDVYQGKGIDKGFKSIAFHLTLGSDSKTLTDEEINSVVEKVTSAIEKEFGAKRR